MELNSIEKLSENLRSISGFALIFMFLLLGSCPVKKAFQSFLDPSSVKEQSASAKGKSLLNSQCSTDNNLIEKIASPERTLTAHSASFVLTVCFLFPFPFISERLKKSFYRVLAKEAPDTVPVFLKNRSILI